MAKVNLKEIFAKLGFLKGIVAFLVPILIAAVGLVLIGGALVLGARLRGNIQEESVKTAKQIIDLMGKVDEAAPAQQLKPYIDAYTKDVNTIENMMRGTTQRELLCYNIFPDTNERSQQLYETFSSRYRSGVNAMLESVKAGVAPTGPDIAEAWRKAPQMGVNTTGASYPGALPQTNMIVNTGTGPAGQLGVSPEMMPAPQRKVFDTLCLERAQNATIYANSLVISGYDFWDKWAFEDRDTAYRDCWYWQLGYWVIEDVMTTIREMNAKSTNVLNAPVKRLMNMDFVLGRAADRGFIRRGTIMQQSRTGNKSADSPTYVTGATDAMTTPCTGRYCNEQIDVIHFNVRVVVESKSAMAFMKQLCSAKPHKFKGWKGAEPVQNLLHNQITILESSTVPVDPQTPVHNIYRYGDAPAVELDLICEYLFDKPTYEDQKPTQVKDDITAAIKAAEAAKAN